MQIRILGIHIYLVAFSLYLFLHNMFKLLFTSSFDTQMTQLDTFSRMKLEQSLKSLRIEADIIEVISVASSSICH